MLSAVLSTMNTTVQVYRGGDRDQDLKRTPVLIGSLHARIEYGNGNQFSVNGIDETFSDVVHLIDTVGVVKGDQLILDDETSHEILHIKKNTFMRDGSVYCSVYV